MTKAELTERIIDALIDPWTDNPEDYIDLDPIDLEEAEEVLKDIRDNESAADLEPDECLPEDVTPAQVQETWNCLLRARKFEFRVERLAEFITENDCVCEYANYYFPEHDGAVDLFPVEFLSDLDSCKLIDGKDMSPLDLIELGQHSPEFNPSHEYCWYDKEKNQLFSTNAPFSDGTIDAEDFARFILCDADALGYFIDGVMDDDDIKHVFGCTKEELINE